jgi:hypothetical protein
LALAFLFFGIYVLRNKSEKRIINKEINNSDKEEKPIVVEQTKESEEGNIPNKTDSDYHLKKFLHKKEDPQPIEKVKPTTKDVPQQKSKKIKILVLFFVLFLSGEIAILFAENQLLAFYGLLKILEAFFVAFYVIASNIKLSKVINVLIGVAIFQGALGIFQFIKGGSVGLYSLGEQPLHLDTPGSPKITFKDERFLRATGTFLHPNILACFLIFVFYLAENAKKLLRSLRWLLIFPLLLTVSRTGAIAFLASALFAPKIRKKFFNVIIIFALACGVLLIVLPQSKNMLLSRLEIDQSIDERVEFTNVSLDFLINHPLGVGAKNFILKMDNIDSTLDIWQFQPVHNIFLLVSNELGIIAGIMLIWLFILAYRASEKTQPLIIAILVFAIFDHFLITIHAGIIILALTFGLAFKDNRFVHFLKLSAVADVAKQEEDEKKSEKIVSEEREKETDEQQKLIEEYDIKKGEKSTRHPERSQ